MAQKRANNLAPTRRARGLRAKDVAKAAGVSIAAYKKYEAGTRFPRPEIAKRLADMLGVSVDWLFFCPPVNILDTGKGEGPQIVDGWEIFRRKGARG